MYRCVRSPRKAGCRLSGHQVGHVSTGALYLRIYVHTQTHSYIRVGGGQVTRFPLPALRSLTALIATCLCSGLLSARNYLPPSLPPPPRLSLSLSLSEASPAAFSCGGHDRDRSPVTCYSSTTYDRLSRPINWLAGFWRLVLGLGDSKNACWVNCNRPSR